MDRAALLRQIADAVRAVAPEHHAAAALHYASGDQTLANEALQLLAQPAKRRDFAPGDRLGAYSIDREIGRGGMGVVYAARRADAEYDKLVALKIVHATGLLDDAARRFRNERQILATLEHPNIARLLDGGVTPEGAPFLVMEYVDGLPFDQFLRTRPLAIPARLHLFLKVCHAVHYAHQHLIIHRDLKPANVIVTAEGEPKLLDFGIAKLLDATGAGQTAETVTGAMMTPGYASPEQAAGRPVSTSSDLYSLGVLLYEMLSGRRPFAELTSGELLYAILMRDAPPLPAIVDTDLNAIVQKCLRKAPAGRYPSVEHFAQDIQRYLERRPVLARQGNFSYLASKFARRHWLPLTGAALLLISILTGAAATYRQKQVAERRFADVRHLAKYLLFDLYDSASLVPGSTPLRADIVKNSLTYLDALAKDAAGDTDLRKEVIEGYIRLGDVQGNLNLASLGDSPRAIETYKKGLALADGDATPAIRSLRALLLLNLGSAQAITGRPEGIDNLKKSAAIYEQIAAASPRDYKAHLNLAQALYALGGQMSQAGGFVVTSSEARKHLDAAVAELELALQLKPADPVAVSTLSSVYLRIGASMGSADPVRSEQYESKALATLERLSPEEKAKPVNMHLRANLMSQNGWTLGQLQRYDDALRILNQSIEMMDKAIAADPRNASFQFDQTGTLRTAGIVSGYAGRREDALGYYRRAVTMHERLLEQDPRSMSKVYRAELLNRIGKIELELGQKEAARQNLKEALRVIREIASQPNASPSQLFEAAQMCAFAPIPELQDLTAAKAFCERALQLAPKEFALHELAGRIAFLRGDKAGAVTELETALQLQPPQREGEPVSRSRLGIQQLLDEIRKP